ncbi:MAG TPA: hypothetical protein PLX06_00140 [Fimbriimonadaceae bacterium]|nr:hypothetical protein [Fimbriimonadaceae bacterium]
MKLILLLIAAGTVMAGCGTPEGAPRPAPVTDADGVETRENGTKIVRDDNGDK